MDEMQLLRELGDATPLATAEQLAPARERLVRAKSHRRPRRIAAHGGAVVGLAAAIFAVFALLPPGDKGGGGGGPVPAASADPVQVLRKAAAAALQIPDVTPRPDQYLYLKTQEHDGAIREDWLSVDGTHDSLFLMPDERTRQPTRMPVPGCRDGRQVVLTKDNTVIPGKTQPCEPNPAYLPDLPTDADGMVKYLNNSGGGKTNSMAKDMLTLLGHHYLRPQSRAALFEAISRIDGLRAVSGATDVAGRPGIQIEWSNDGYSGDFIVDANTYALLGDARYTALLTVAIVDGLEQRPSV